MTRRATPALPIARFAAVGNDNDEAIGRIWRAWLNASHAILFGVYCRMVTDEQRHAPDLTKIRTDFSDFD